MSAENQAQMNEPRDWQKADARILGQILAAQNIIFAFIEPHQIAEFYAQALFSIPGITGCRVCLGDKSVQAGKIESSVCEKCEVLRQYSAYDQAITVNSGVKCSLAGQANLRFFSIHSDQHHFGYFIFKIDDASTFNIYQPFITNLANYVTLSLENRLQQTLLLKTYDELERKVKERTQDLAEANAALKDQYSTLHVIIDSIDASVFSVDRQYQYTSFNNAHAATMKMIYGAKIKLGGSLLDYMTVPDDCKKARQNLDRVLAGEQFAEEAYSGEEMRSRRYYRIAHSPIKTEDGSIVGVVVLSQDITEHKLFDEKISKLNEELEQRVIERTSQLEAANKELEAFSYSVSHDLRAPLRRINGFVEILKEGDAIAFDEESRLYLNKIGESAKEMGNLINDLLSFSRMSRNELNRSQVDLNELIADVVRECAAETETRNIQWLISPLPPVMGDRAMLRVVIVNLLSNALKFTRTRKLARIEIGWRDGVDNEIVIYIRDNGVGFDKTYTDKLFGVFQRLHRSSEFEGTGIGLANVRRIINRHGGKTWAEGEVENGATFYFTLPRYRKSINPEDQSISH